MPKQTKQRKVKRARVRPLAKTSEVTRLGAALRALGSLGGGAVGGLVGLPAGGASVGSSLGAALSKWLGSGDYSVANNTIVKQSLKASSSIPVMHDSGQSVTIRHREYLGEITSSTGFSVYGAFELNPGNSRTFPWLSSIASNFQEYKFKGIVFHYIPTSGSAISASSAPLGSVMMQTSYRVTDAPPASKVALLNEYNANESIPSECFAHPIECDPKENPFAVQYVRNGDVPAGDNKMMYDLGVTYLATNGQLTSAAILGDLWITYEVELKKPILSSNVTNHGRLFSASYTGGTMTSTDVFNGTVVTGGNITATLSGTTFTLPKGSAGIWYFMLRVLSSGGGFTTTTSSAPTPTNCTLSNWAAVPNVNGAASNVGAGSTLGSFLFIGAFTVADPAVAASIKLNFTLTGASAATQFTLLRAGDVELF